MVRTEALSLVVLFPWNSATLLQLLVIVPLSLVGIDAGTDLTLATLTNCFLIIQFSHSHEETNINPSAWLRVGFFRLSLTLQGSSQHEGKPNPSPMSMLQYWKYNLVQCKDCVESSMCFFGVSVYSVLTQVVVHCGLVCLHWRRSVWSGHLLHVRGVGREYNQPSSFVKLNEVSDTRLEPILSETVQPCKSHLTDRQDFTHIRLACKWTSRCHHRFHAGRLIHWSSCCHLPGRSPWS